MPNLLNLEKVSKSYGVRPLLTDVSLGIGANRVRTVSYGKEFPFDPGHQEGAWSKNRRAHFVITAR